MKAENAQLKESPRQIEEQFVAMEERRTADNFPETGSLLLTERSNIPGRMPSALVASLTILV